MWGFIGQMMSLWRRQHKAWRVVVVWMVVHRFLRRFVEQYASIYIRLLGASPVQLGAAQSTAGLAAALVSLPLGIAHDRYSLRKIYLSGIALLTIMPLLYATAPSWQWLIPGIVLFGLGQRLGACGVICDLSLPNHDRATAKALCEGVGALPILFGPAAAAVVITLLGGITTRGIRALYWVYFIIGAAATIYAFRNLPEIERLQQCRQRSSVLAEIKEVFLRGRALKLYMIMVATSEFAMLMLMTFIFPYSHEVGLATPVVLGMMSTAMTLAEAIFSTVFGRLADHWGRRSAYLCLVPFFVISNVLLLMSPTPAMMVVSGFLLGFRLIGSVVYTSLGPELVPRECIGRWRGVLGLLAGLAHIVAPVTGGYLWTGLGPRAVFQAVILVDLLVAVPLMIALPETLKKQRHA